MNTDDVIAAYLYMSTGKATAQRPGELGPQDVHELREGPTVADASELFDCELREFGAHRVWLQHARRGVTW